MGSIWSLLIRIGLIYIMNEFLKYYFNFNFFLGILIWLVEEELYIFKNWKRKW